MDEVEQGFSSLSRGPWNGDDPNDVLGQSSNMASVPTSGIEDIGFTPEQLGLVRDGLYNADFRTPPPDPDSELDDLTNKLPGWSYVKSGTRVTAKWVTDTSGGHVRFYTSGVNGTDSAYVEQVMPVSATIRTSVIHRLWVDHGGSAGVPTLWVTAQYLDSTGATTGTAGTLNLDPTTSRVEVITPNGASGVPSTAHFARVRIGVTADDASDISANGARLVPTLRSNIWWETISSGRTDWEPVSAAFWASVDTLAVDGGASDRNITGLVAPPLVGTRKTVHNSGTTNNLVLVHDATSSANNRFYCPNNADFTIRSHGSVDVVYMGDADGSHLRWRVIHQ